MEIRIGTDPSVGHGNHIQYTAPDILQSFPDVTIICTDRGIVINRTVLAAQSYLLRNALRDLEPSIEDAVIITEIPGHLADFIYEYLTTGFVDAEQSRFFDLHSLRSCLSSLNVHLPDSGKTEGDVPVDSYNEIDEQSTFVPNNTVPQDLPIKVEVSENGNPQDSKSNEWSTDCKGSEGNSVKNNGEEEGVEKGMVPVIMQSDGSFIKSKNGKILKGNICKLQFHHYEKDGGELMYLPKTAFTPTGRFRIKRGPQKGRGLKDDNAYTDGKFKCSKCPETFETRISREHHVRRHTRKDPRHMFFCFMCEAGFETNEECKAHKNVVHKDSKLKCPHCDKVYIGYRVRQLERHIADIHVNPIPHVCVACGVKFKSKYGLKVHKKKMGPYHTGDCAACGEKFASWPDHETHVRLKHDGVWKFRCGLCSEVLSHLKHLRAHKQHSHPEADNNPGKMCEWCGKSFKDLKGHMQDVHGNNPVKCKECGKEFRHPHSLERHMRKVHSEGFPCAHCGKIQKTAARYKVHVATMHTADDQKPFKCTICSKGFGIENNLHEHMNIHMNLRPFVCKYCSASFNSSGNMYAHIRATHLGIKRNHEKKKRA